MHLRVWRLAGPIILANLTVPLIGLVDTAVMGHLDHAYYIGAVAVGAQLFSYLFWIFNFLRMGTTGPAAQALGAGDRIEAVATLLRAVLAGGAIGLALILLQRPIMAVTLPAFAASPEVERLAGVYLAIRIWAAPATLAASAMVGWFVAVQRTRAVFAVQVATNLVNVGLCLLFVVGLDWDVAGVAAASLIAEWSGVLLAFAIAYRLIGKLGGIESALVPARLFDRARLLRMVAINRDIFLRTLCTVGATAVFMSASAGLGEIGLAANAVLLNFLTLVSFGLDGFAHAAEALVGRAVGAHDRGELRRAVVVSLLWALVTAALVSLLYALGGRAVVHALTGLDEVRSAAEGLLPWVVLAPLAGVWCFQLDGIFLGATRSRELRNAMVLSFAIYLGAIAVLQPLWGAHGLWAAMMIFLVVRGLTLAARYPRLEREVGSGLAAPH